MLYEDCFRLTQKPNIAAVKNINKLYSAGGTDMVEFPNTLNAM